MTSVPAYDSTANATVTFPVIGDTGMISVIGAARKDRRTSGPCRLVTMVDTRCCRLTNHR
jgi:hypothetical protein